MVISYINLKGQMKKILLISVFSILCICGCAYNKKADFDYTNEEQIEKEILINLDAILEVSDTTSSNPFDYTKNEYYDNIVKLGNDAVYVLENMYKSGELSGLSAYISALAIEDITKCNLHDEYDLDWSTPEEFYSLWEDNNCSFKE